MEAEGREGNEEGGVRRRGREKRRGKGKRGRGEKSEGRGGELPPVILIPSPGCRGARIVTASIFGPRPRLKTRRSRSRPTFFRDLT